MDVVDDLLAHVDRCAVQLECAFHGLNSAVDAIDEAGYLRLNPDVAGSIARGEFERARQLTEAAIRLRARGEQFASEEAIARAKKNKNQRASLDQEDGRQAGKDASGPGDGDGGIDGAAAADDHELIGHAFAAGRWEFVDSKYDILHRDAGAQDRRRTRRRRHRFPPMNG